MDCVTRSRSRAQGAELAPAPRHGPAESPRASVENVSRVASGVSRVASTVSCISVQTAVDGRTREATADRDKGANLALSSPVSAISDRLLQEEKVTHRPASARLDRLFQVGKVTQPPASARSGRSSQGGKAALMRRKRELEFQMQQLHLEREMAEVDELLAEENAAEADHPLGVTAGESIPPLWMPVDLDDVEQNENVQGLLHGEWPHQADANVDRMFHVGPQGVVYDTPPVDRLVKNTEPGAVEAALHTNIGELAKAINNLAFRPTPSTNIDVSFSGKPCEWLIFKAAFEESNKIYGRSNAEKVSRLRTLLKGEALEAASALLFGGGEADVIMEALERRFANPDQLVHDQVNMIKSLPRLFNFGKDLSIFANKIQTAVATLQLLNRKDYVWSPELNNAVVSKMTPLLRSMFVNFAAEDKRGLAPLELLSQFLNTQADRHMKYGGAALQPGSSMSTGAVLPGNRTFSHKVCVSVEEAKECIYCNGKHEVTDCKKFLLLPCDDRWRYVTDKKLCFNCLKIKHRRITCKAKKCSKCKKAHHTLLHFNARPVEIHAVRSSHSQPALQWTPQPAAYLPTPGNRFGEYLEISQPSQQRAEPTATTSKVQESVAESVTVTHATTPQRRALLKIAPIVVCGPKGTVETYALLDEGSTTSLIDAAVAEQIGIVGPVEPLFVNAISGLKLEGVLAQTVNFDVRGKYSEELFTVEGAKALPQLALSGQSMDIHIIENCEHLADIAEMLIHDLATPTVLLGQDQWPLIVSAELRRGKPSQPVASRTALGWVAHGTYYSTARPLHRNNFVSTKPCLCGLELETLIKSQYALDAIGVTKKEVRSADDERALKILKETTNRLPNGRFEVGLLWRTDNQKMPSSYGLAMSRLRSTERKMDKDPAYAARYISQIQDMLDKGYAVKCEDTTTESQNSRRWYLPHFGVINPNKPNKLRIVHDAAAPVHGVSLNSALLVGPDLIQPLMGILLRFREGKFALTGDIREMFPQVKIRSNDREAQRFLWRGSDRDRTPDQYEMVSLIFEAASSPCSAIYVKTLNALEHANEYPEAATVIIEDHYVDDCITSLDDEEKAAELAADVTKVHQFAGYEIRGWASNSLVALKGVPESLRDATMIELKPHDSSTQRILGLLWDTVKDTLGFCVNLNRIPSNLRVDGEAPTKRQLLATVMSVFDPLGLLGPLVVQGRMLFQDAWRSKVDWDEQLKPVEKAKWKAWLELLHTVVQVKIPRWYRVDLEPIRRELHTFCDAGEAGYGAVCYWRFLYNDGSIQVALIASKSRVSPLKAVSIPRLELQAALLGSRLASYLVREQRKKPDKLFFWSDSRTVLCWLRSDHRNYKPYVAHRVSEILDLTPLERWRWVPSEDNVADLLTKVGIIDSLNPEGIWFNGPTFIYRSEDTWRKELVSSEVVTEELRVTATQVAEPGNLVPVTPDVNRFSKWLKYVRSMAFVIKFCNLLLKRKTSQPLGIGRAIRQTPCLERVMLSQVLTAGDIQNAEMMIWRSVQAQHFSEEIRCLKSARPLPKCSKLVRLSPYLDTEGLLRVEGRIGNVEDVDIEKRPLILPANDRTVRLVIERYHEQYGHANNETVFNLCRQVYWVIGLRNLVRAVASDCLPCKIRRATPVIPPEGALPSERLAHHQRPFTHVGLDYFGPVLISIARRHEKRWVALFTCLTTRAISLDLVGSLSADAAIMALRRFIARRGCPTTIISDNGTAFRGASNEIRRARGEVDGALQVFSANNNITWKFLPPAAPSMGGAWERLVQNVKRTLQITLKQRVPKEETFATLLAEAEHIVNARPLTYVPTDVCDPEALTPLHFILGSPSRSQSSFGASDNGDLVRRKEWRKAQRLADHFWARWVKEYLPTLRPSHYTTTGANYKEGDVVLVADPALPRNTWPLGRVMKLYPGKDGITRVMDVMTRGGAMKRPVCKIVPLPLPNDMSTITAPSAST